MAVVRALSSELLELATSKINDNMAKVQRSLLFSRAGVTSSGLRASYMTNSARC